MNTYAPSGIIDSISDIVTTKVIDIYARISRDYDGTLRKVESQLAQGVLAVQRHADQGWKVGLQLKDPYMSGWNPNVVRKDFQAMMTRLESGISHGLWVYDLSRFTRKPKEGERLIDLAKRGILVLSAYAGYDLCNPEDQKRFRDEINQFNYESNKISQRTTDGKRAKAVERGRSNASTRPFGVPGNEPPPSGWHKGMERVFVPVPDALVEAEREVLRSAAERLLAGTSMHALAIELYEQGVRGTRGHVISATSLKQLLVRPSTAGLLEYKKQIVGELACGGALDRDTWEAVRGLLDSHRTGPGAPPKYLLSGGAMRCGKCGTTRLSGRPNYDGSGPTYRCGVKSPTVGCGGVSINMAWADEVVKHATIHRLADPTLRRELSARSRQGSSRRAAIEAELANLEASSVELYARAGRGEISDARRDAGVVPMDRRSAALRAELETLDEVAALPIETDVAELWKVAEEAGDLNARRDMVKRAFPNLTIRPCPPISRGRAARNPARFDWSGESLPAAV